MQVNPQDIQLSPEQRDLLAGAAARWGTSWDVVLKTVLAPLATPISETAGTATGCTAVNGTTSPDWLDVQCHTHAEAAPAQSISLEEVRTRLQSIEGSLSAVVSAERDRS